MSSAHPGPKSVGSENLDKTVLTAGTADPNAAADQTFVPAANTAAGDDQTFVPPAAAQPAARPASKGDPADGLTHLGDFRFIRKLGEGGMGAVYLAHQDSLDRKAAVKLLSTKLAGKGDFVKRFYREAKSMAKIDHPNAVRVYAVDEDQGVHFVAMEYIDGKSMQYWIEKQGRLSIGDALHVTLRCAEALQAAHAQNMVHRDIKPDNIMLTAKGAVKVADFGLAKALDDEDNSLTQSGTGLGTPYYMAPEQARNAKHVDGRCDIYALGVTLYHFLTGELPFGGNSTMELLINKEKGIFTSARKKLKELPERLDLVIDKMVAANPEHRFKDCSEVIRMLAGLGLESPSLSFIDAPDRVVATAAAPGTRTTAPGASQVMAKAAQAKPGGETPAKPAAAPGSETLWYVQFKNAQGKDTLAKFSTAQIGNALRAGGIPTSAKAKKKADGAFLPLASYPEFETIVSGVNSRAGAQKRAGEVKKIYASLDRQQKWRKTIQRITGIFSGAFGALSLIVYLALIGAALFLAYKFLPTAWDTMAKQVNERNSTSSPDKLAPSPDTPQ